MNTFPELVSLSCLEEIILQSKKSIGKIEKKDGRYEKSTGFFCHIQCDKKRIPVFIINDPRLYQENINTIKISIDIVKKII